jgi:ribose 5-phosphate isomerase
MTLFAIYTKMSEVSRGDQDLSEGLGLADAMQHRRAVVADVGNLIHDILTERIADRASS